MQGALESGQSAFNGVARNRERQAEVPGPPKTRARHGQDALVHKAAHKGQVIRYRRLGKHVEGSLRFCDLIAHPGQAFPEQIAFFLVRAGINLEIGNLRDDPLPDGGSIDETQDPVGEGASVAQRLQFRQAGREGQVTDPLPGNRQSF